MTAVRERQKEFFNYIRERQRIHVRKDINKEPAPWTKDPVLRDYHFCNNFRELDACSRILYAAVGPKGPSAEVLLNVVAFRFFNQRWWFDEMGWLRPHRVRRGNRLYHLMCTTRERRGRLFSPAYRITQARPYPHTDFEGKHGQVYWVLYDLAAGNFVNQRVLRKLRTPEGAMGTLQAIPLVGPFLAYQIALDLCHLGWFSHRFTDSHFYYVGPGALPGLQYIYGPEAVDSNNAASFLRGLVSMQGRYLKDATWHTPEWANKHRHLSAANMQFCLCEFRKYKATRRRRRFNGSGN